jgi:hypothetical protein
MRRRAVRPYTLGRVSLQHGDTGGWRLAVRALCPCVPLQQVTGACLLAAAAPFHRNQEMSRRLGIQSQKIYGENIPVGYRTQCRHVSRSRAACPLLPFERRNATRSA